MIGPGEVRKRIHFRAAPSTSVRSNKAAAILAVAVLGALAVLPATVAADGFGGTVGFITRDGLFFVQVGFTFISVFTAEPNGSQIYAYSLTVNISSLVAYNATAFVRAFSLYTNQSIGNLTIPVSPYGVSTLDIPLPTTHNWGEVRISVDGTRAYYYVETPYSFLGITGLEDGGLDLMAFTVVGLLLALGLPVMVKSERMTKRAVYAPRWNATMWLHGIFFGLLGWYVINFPTINSFFHGAEFVAIPIPEVLFLFFWNAGRHSTNKKALFIQVVPRLGHRMGLILKSYFIGKDPEGDLVIMKQRSPFQWYYRAKGHHVKLFVRDPKNPRAPLEPGPLEAREFKELARGDFRNPARFGIPRAGKFDAADDFEVLNEDEGDDAPITRVYLVPRLSDFKVSWPYATWHKWKSYDAYEDRRGNVHPAGKRWAICWPYIVDGRAEVTLASWHYVDVLAQALGWIKAEDMVREIENLEVQLAAFMGELFQKSRRSAEIRLNALEDVRNRPESDLTIEQAEALVPPDRKRKEDRPGATDARSQAGGG